MHTILKDFRNCIFMLAAAVAIVACDDSGVKISTFSDCVQVSAGSEHSCCLHDDGHISCWGDKANGKLTPPDGQQFIAVGAGGEYTCGITTEGRILCWGSNDVCIGIDNNCWAIGTLEPPEGTGFVLLDTGPGHACALHESGAISCWGSNGSEQTAAPMDTDFVQVSVGCDHTCGLHKSGKLSCWGYDGYSQASLPRHLENDDYSFSQISLGCYHTCTLFSDRLQYDCWGNTGFGQTTSQTEDDRTPIVSIEAGAFFSCRIQSEGRITCWGSRTVPYGDGFTSMSGGGSHACALHESGRVYCWGDNFMGQASPP